MNIYFECVKTLINKEILVKIFSDVYNDEYVGFIRCVSNELVLLDSFELGKPDGIKIFKLDDITRIRWEGNELEEIDLIIKNNDDNIETNIKDIYIDNMRQAVESVQRIYGYATIFIQQINKNICFIGEVEQIDDSTVIMHEFATFDSSKRSYLLFSVQDITRIDSGGIYEKQLLHHQINK
jgi:hypothetical protein